MSGDRPSGKTARHGTAPDGAVPTATYRWQFHKGFGFRDAARLATYLADLGVSHCYASPYLKAHPGSTHGYDIVDHSCVNPEVGSEDERRKFVAALRRQGLSQIMDIVPNHMRVDDPDNRLWWDVLAHGRCSLFAHYFDIDWKTPERSYEDKLVIPILGGQYGEVLESGAMALDFDPGRGGFVVRYYDHILPISPKSYPQILAEVAQSIHLGAGDEALGQEISELIALFERTSVPADGSAPEEAARLIEEGARRLGAWVSGNARCAGALSQVLARYNAGAGAGAERYDALHGLLEQQAYRLTFWRVAGYEINYRRFFDINELAALRMEDPGVFATTHGLIGAWIASGDVAGLRVDHPDGLRDPREYFARLQDFACAARDGGARGVEASAGRVPFYLVVEKILGADESLPDDWPVSGTTGYDFLRLASGVLVSADGEAGVDAAYEAFMGARDDYASMLYECKGLIMHTSLGSEVHTLGIALDRIAERDRRTRDFTLSAQRTALFEIVACFPVYRTYVSAPGASSADRSIIEAACARAKERNPLVEVAAVDFIRDLLLLEGFESRTPEERVEILEFIAAFQQYTGPVMAKGLEDTLFYRYNRLVSLNEVGGDPSRFAVSLKAFHEANGTRLRERPTTMLATSTHDTKRSEDVRARLHVLSEIPEAWAACAQQLKEHHQSLKALGGLAPSVRDEYLFYQTLIGVWPFVRTPEMWADVRARLRDYMLKAAREAKCETSWVKPVCEYEDALIAFVDAVTDPEANARTLDALESFAAPVARAGLWTALSQLALKLLAPGVPDIYQGTELWDFSLVDPDNRRPVDYGERTRMLAEIARLDDADELARAHALAAWLANPEDGHVKMHTTRCLLRLRRTHPEICTRGSYEALYAEGERARHLICFARCHEDQAWLVVVPRHYWALTEGGRRLPTGSAVWGGTRVPVPASCAAWSWRHVLAPGVAGPGAVLSQRMLAAELLAEFPIAVLVGSPRGYEVRDVP
ncbi:MAG: malto-oligosyltrehalose synthase [Acidiferrobacter sp.]